MLLIGFVSTIYRGFEIMKFLRFLFINISRRDETNSGRYF